MAQQRVVERLKDLKADPRNARRHGPRNVGAIVSAMREVGAARSIVIDERAVVLAGNAAVEAAAKAGVTKVKVVDVDGKTLVAVRRKGLTKAQKALLALADNRAAELADGWDVEVLRGLQAEGVDLGALWNEGELAGLFGETPSGTEPEHGDEAGGSSAYQEQYGVVVICRSEKEQREVYERLTADGLACKVVAT